MEKLIDYSFIPVPRIYQFLDDKCFRFMVFMIDKERFYRSSNKLDSKGYFFMSNETISNVLGYSTKTINNIVETLYRNKIINVISEGKQGKLITNRYSINYEVINSITSKIERVDRNEIKSYRGQNSTGRNNNTETNFGNNSTDNFGQNSTVGNNISYKSIKNNIYGPNIGPNIYSYIEGKKDFSSKSEGKINCFLSDSEIEGYINSSEAESNPIAESETVNNRDNSNIDNLNKEKLEETNIDNNISTVNSDNSTANAVTEEVDNLNSVKPVTEEIESNNSVNSNSVNSENNLDNLNEVNTAVLSHSNIEFEELVISTEKMSENGLKQAKIKELEIINKTDNLNSVKPKEEKVETNNIDNSKLVNSDNRTNNISTIVEYSTANAELESNNSVNSKNVIPNNNLDNSKNVNSNTANAVTEKVDNLNSVRSKEEGIEGENKTDNSNLNINSTIAEGDNSTANAVQEFRDKCINYTIILEGEKIEIGEITPKEFVAQYYSELMKNIYDTSEFDRQRKLFNRMLKDNNLNGQHYNEMSDNLDIRYARYTQVDKELNKQTEKEEFSNEEVQYIANELLNQCLDFTLTKDNRMQDFYDLRNNYNAFIEQYNIPKEGLKLQKKFAELSVVNKKLNTPVNSQSFAN